MAIIYFDETAASNKSGFFFFEEASFTGPVFSVNTEDVPV